MTIPKYDELWPYALDFLKDGTERKISEIVNSLSKRLKLTEEEMAQMYESGNGPVFYLRVGWAA